MNDKAIRGTGLERILQARQLLRSANLARVLNCSGNSIDCALCGVRHGPVSVALDQMGTELQIEAMQAVIDKMNP